MIVPKINKKVAILAGFFYLIGLYYLLLPGPSSIGSFPRLPNYSDFNDPRDYQNPNTAVFYSSNRRSYVTQFFKENYQKLNCPDGLLKPINILCIIPPISLNHPPEEALIYIQDEQKSTYLEQYTYPFRSAIYVNGFEPFDQNGKPFTKTERPIIKGEKHFDTQVIARFYPTNIFVRVVIYTLAWILFLTVIKVFFAFLKKDK